MNRNYKVIWNKSLGCFTAVAEYAKSRGKSSNSAVSSTSSASAAVSTGARLLRLSSLTVALAATGLTLSTQVLAETGTLGGVGDGTAISVCTGLPVDGVVNTDNAANAVTPNSIAIGCNTSTGDTDFNLLDAGNPNNGAVANGNNNPGGVLFSTTNSDTVSSSTVVGSNAAATGNLSTAYGSQARATGGSSVALGVAAVATTDGAIATGLQSAATGRFSQASGVVSSATGDGSTAIGHSSNASGYRSIAIGATDLNNDPLGFGGYGYNEADATRATADNTIAFGGGAKATADQAVAIGLSAEANSANGVALGQNSTIANDADNAVAIGSENTVNTNNTIQQGISNRRDVTDLLYPTGEIDYLGTSVALGSTNSTGAGGGMALGSNNQVIGDFYGIALGQGNITGDGTLTDGYGIGLGVGNLSTGNTAIAIGTANESTGNTSIAIGRQTYSRADFGIAAGNIATVEAGATNGIALGTSSNVAAAGVNSIAIGTNSNAGDANSVAIGSGSQATGSSSISIGTGNIVSGNNSGAIGDPSTITGTGSYSLGNDNTIDADNAFAIGNNISIAAGLDGAVGIGNNTTVAESTVASFVPTGATVVGTAVGSNVVSIGDAGSERRLTNVAAGGADTDAVNVSQLEGLSTTVDDNTTRSTGNLAALGGNAAYDAATDTYTAPTYTLDNGANTNTTADFDNVGDALGNLDGRTATNTSDIANIQTQSNIGFNISAAGGADDNVQLGETVDFTNTDGNLVVTNDVDNGINYDLAENIDLGVNGSVTTGDTVVNNAGVAIDDGVGNTNVSTATGNIIDDDAGNVTTLTGAGTNVTDGVNTSNYGAEGFSATDGTTSTVFNQAGITFLDATDTPVGPSITATGIDAGDTVITSVSDGSLADGSTDAINGSQLNTAADSIAANLGGGSAFDPATGEVTAPTYTLDNGTNTNTTAAFDNVGDALGNLDGRTTINTGDIADIQAQSNLGFNVSAAGGADDNVQLGETVDFTNTDGNLVVTNDVDNGINYDLAENIDLGVNGSVTTGDTVVNNAGVAIDDGAGNATTITTGGTNVVDTAGNSADYTAIGSTLDDGNGNTNVSTATGNIIDDDAGNVTTLTGAGTNVTDGVNTSNYGAEGFSATDAAGNNGISVNQGGISFIDGAGALTGPSVTAAGFNAGGTVITNVADGVLATDAATKGQVDAVSDGLADLTAGTVQYDTNPDDTVNKGSITLGGGAAGTTITNVNGGAINAGSTDAINGGQLFDLGNDVAGIIGGDAALDADGNLTASNIGGTGANNLNDAIAAVNNGNAQANEDIQANTDRLDTGLSFSADTGTNVDKSIGDSTAVSFEGSDNITTTTTDSGIKFDLSGNISVDSVTADTVTTGNTTVNTNGVTIANGPSMTTEGINAGSKTITGVADGVEVNDAVNFGQLSALDGKLSNSVNELGYKINEVEDDANAGISAAMAMSSLPQAYIPGKSMVGGGIATYNGQSAVAIGLSKVSDNGRWVIKVNGTADTQGNAGGAVGAGFHF
jgi:hypothetical protein